MIRIAVLVCPLLLASSSSLTDLSARFIDGRLAFVARDGGSVDCVRNLSVTDAATHETMWTIEDGDACVGGLPIRYGDAGRATAGRAKPLVPGRRYEVSGVASGGNYLSGHFVLSRVAAWRVTDLPPDKMETDVNDTANQLQ